MEFLGKHKLPIVLAGSAVVIGAICLVIKNKQKGHKIRYKNVHQHNFEKLLLN